jgi:hypothetical protein
VTFWQDAMVSRPLRIQFEGALLSYPQSRRSMGSDIL